MKTNTEIYKEFIYCTYNQGCLSKLTDYVATRVIEHQKGIYPPTIEGVEKWIAVLRDSFSDLKMTISEIAESGDRTWARMLLEGKHVKEFMGIPASGKHFVIDIQDEARYHESKIIEHWGVFDRFALVQQIRTGQGLSMPMEGGDQSVEL